jgi:hypothetical protein
VSSFAVFQESLRRTWRDDLTYQVFDILHLNGKDLTRLPLVERKRILKALRGGCAPIPLLRPRSGRERGDELPDWLGKLARHLDIDVESAATHGRDLEIEVLESGLSIGPAYEDIKTPSSPGLSFMNTKFANQYITGFSSTGSLNIKQTRD